MKRTINTFILVVLVNLLHAQNPLVKQWDYRFGGADTDYPLSFQETIDGGFIMGGNSSSGISGDKTQPSWSTGIYDYWIVKTDWLGIKQWDKRFGGNDLELLYSLQQTSDGGYILGGGSYSDSSGDKTEPSWGGCDFWIVKTDSLGNKQWDKRFGGTDDDILRSLQQTKDGGYILGGQSQSGISGDKTEASRGNRDYWIVKTDSLGNKQWDKRFGGTDFDVLTSLQQTDDTGYIFGGVSSSGIGGDKTQANWSAQGDYWIVKVDSLGNKQWDKRFGGGGDDGLSSLQQTTDGGYILGGLSSSTIGGDRTQPSWGQYDYWIVKTNSIGIKQWDKRFGGTNDDDENPGYTSQTKDGGYLIGGTSYSPISGDKTESNLGYEQTWIVKTDSSGIKQWDKTIFTTSEEESGFVIQTRAGCFVLANYTYAGIGGYKTQPSWGSADFWLLKFCDTTQCNIITPTFIQNGDTLFVPLHYATYQWYHDSIPISGATHNYYVAPTSGNYNIIVADSNGCSVGAGILNVVASGESISSSGQFVIFPNPTTNNFILKNISPKEKVLLDIINVLGEIVYTRKLSGKNEYLVDANFARGIYFVRVSDEEKNVLRKLIVE